ncbi:MAG: hypothetical protein H0Z40_01045 [Desulfotomaculum sp.]|nr:hypothetical protein [Desulfotomaculum sp.]
MMNEENVRFDWDILLEKDPANPPVKKELPVEDKRTADTITQEEPPSKEKEQRQEAVKEKPGEEAVISELNKKCNMNSSRGRRQEPAVLKGRLTPNALINGFIVSELLGPPGGLSRKRRINRYL